VAAGEDPRKDSEVNRRRAAAISEGHRRNRDRSGEHASNSGDEAWFRREVLPKLDSFSLTVIGAATGLSPAACSRIRSGKRVPDPRHWEALVALVEETNS
jgi:hypothetical protein